MAQHALTGNKEEIRLGKADRHIVPLARHADWSPPRNRDLMKLVTMRDANRIARLLPERNRRMSASPLAFLRGAATVMAADLDSCQHTNIIVQACGDCHLMNFGAYFTPEGHPVFDVNDFDETAFAPFEWDVKRLAASLYQAGHEESMCDAACRDLARTMAKTYSRQIRKLATRPPIEAWFMQIDLAGAIKAIPDGKLRRAEEARLARIGAVRRQQLKIIERRKGGLRLMPGQTDLMHPLNATETAVADAAFASAAATLPAERRALLGRYELVDRAFKVVGVGSVGTFCAILLLSTPENDPLLLQIKASEVSAVAPYCKRNNYTHQGERVVAGQRMMQATPDIFLAPARVEPAQDFYQRRLKDTRLAKIGEIIGGKKALRFRAHLCALALARAHGRSGAAARIAAYIGEGESFAKAIAAFARAYAAQTRADYAVFCDAIRS
jgi:uncharacterized protein (DUF2252 family)